MTSLSEFYTKKKGNRKATQYGLDAEFSLTGKNTMTAEENFTLKRAEG